MVVFAQQQQEIREDAADAEQPVTATPSVSSHQGGFYHLQEQWEAAIVKSMSERPDEIIDILERYAEERQLSMREGEEEEWGSDYFGRAQSQSKYDDVEEYTFDESRDPTEETTSQQDGRLAWSNARERFVAEFLAELRTKVARLTYMYPPSSLASMQSFSASHNPGDDEQRSENHFQAELDAEVLKSNNLELQLEESKHFYEGQLQQMRDRIEYLKETQPHQGRVATACGEDESASKLEEASHMEMTQMVMDETTLHGESESNGLLLELQDKVSVLSKALTDMEQENVDLKEALAVMHHHRQATGHNGIPGEGDDLERNSELEVELESTQNELSWMKSRWKALDVLVLRSEHLLEIQGKKLEKSENALKKTRELYAYERSARLSIERINETTQIVMGKLHGKMEDRRYEIDQLQGLLTQYNLEGHEIV